MKPNFIKFHFKYKPFPCPLCVILMPELDSLLNKGNTLFNPEQDLNSNNAINSSIFTDPFIETRNLPDTYSEIA
jgi:hypothetical protein